MQPVICFLVGISANTQPVTNHLLDDGPTCRDDDVLHFSSFFFSRDTKTKFFKIDLKMEGGAVAAAVAAGGWPVSIAKRNESTYLWLVGIAKRI